jgi:hypothetical protein
MQNLDKRISALEQASPAMRDIVIFIRYETPGELGKEVFDLVGDCSEKPRQQWTREQGESEKHFTDRAKREVKRNAWGVATLFQTDLENSHAIT